MRETGKTCPCAPTLTPYPPASAMREVQTVLGLQPENWGARAHPGVPQTAQVWAFVLGRGSAGASEVKHKW